MENASKALIIAGAILLAILLISLGIMIYNQAQDTVSNSGMSEAQISAFNNKFIKYEGTDKTASEIRALINEINVSNATLEDEGLTPITVPTINIVNTHKYTVTLTYDGEGGRVSAVAVNDQ